MPCGPLVHRAPAMGIILRYMRRDVHPAKFAYQFLRVVILVSSQRHSLSHRDRFGHQHRRFPLRSSMGLGHKGLYQQTVAVLHQYMSQACVRCEPNRRSATAETETTAPALSMGALPPSTISQTAATSLSGSHPPSCGRAAMDDRLVLASPEKRS